MASKINVDKIARNSGTPEFTIPTADGTNGQAIVTNGSGVLSFADAGPSLTGSTNTWIPTITGANAMAGTANFTYDGNTLDIKNGGTASSINLYCETGNAHYTKIKSGPHSGATSYTLTLPNKPPTVSGQVLSATTAGVASWAGAAITDCSIWRLTTSFNGDANPIASNLEEDDGPDYVRLGAAMTESAGIFTFPSTGFWRIDFSGIGKNNAANNHMDLTIESVISGTSDNRAKNSIGWSSFNYAGTYCSTLFDVSNTTTHKCSFSVNHTSQSNGLQGDTNNNETCFIFTRLADT